MNESSRNPDRKILGTMKAGWTNDPELDLTEGELDRLLRHFDVSRNATESELRPAINWQFRSFMEMATEERFRESNGRLEKVSKSSTIVGRQMKQLQKACEKFDAQLAKLDPVTRTWLDQFLKDNRAEDDNGQRVRLREIEKHINRQIDLLIYAAHNAENITSRGPNNMALRVMIEGLADWWEKCHGRRPITDKGRGLREDPFLELCQEMAHIGDARLKTKGSGLGSLQLSGLVADVLKNRPFLAKETPPEK